jgi:hypothetical protein
MTKIPLIIALLVCGLSLAAGPAAADEVTLAWDHNSEPDLAGNRLYMEAGYADEGFRLLTTIPRADI